MSTALGPYLTVVDRYIAPPSTAVRRASPCSARRGVTHTQSAATGEEGLFLKILALVVLATAMCAALANSFNTTLMVYHKT